MYYVLTFGTLGTAYMYVFVMILTVMIDRSDRIWRVDRSGYKLY